MNLMNVTSSTDDDSATLIVQYSNNKTQQGMGQDLAFVANAYKLFNFQKLYFEH